MVAAVIVPGEISAPVSPPRGVDTLVRWPDIGYLAKEQPRAVGLILNEVEDEHVEVVIIVDDIRVISRSLSVEQVCRQAQLGLREVVAGEADHKSAADGGAS